MRTVGKRQSQHVSFNAGWYKSAGSAYTATSSFVVSRSVTAKYFSDRSWMGWVAPRRSQWPAITSSIMTLAETPWHGDRTEQRRGVAGSRRGSGRPRLWRVERHRRTADRTPRASSRSRAGWEIPTASAGAAARQHGRRHVAGSPRRSSGEFRDRTPGAQGGAVHRSCRVAPGGQSPVRARSACDPSATLTPSFTTCWMR